jgi:hypothetical protein
MYRERERNKYKKQLAKLHKTIALCTKGGERKKSKRVSFPSYKKALHYV